MTILKRWLFVLWILAGLLLPGASALRLCACSGALSFEACPCEVPAVPQPESCCSSASTDQQESKPLGAGAHAPASCKGCMLIAVPETALRVSWDAPVLVNPLPAPRLSFVLPALVPSAAQQAQRLDARDPPGSRRNRELRV
jgi:hypothetical protein